jgi:hypothetical protein
MNILLIISILALNWTNLRAENLLYLLNGGVCILHYIVYQSSLTMGVAT